MVGWLRAPIQWRAIEGPPSTRRLIRHPPSVALPLNLGYKMAEHDPVEYTASIAMTYNQMLQVGYAIRQRMTEKIINETNSPEYPYADEQIEALAAINEALEEHIETI